MGLVGLQKRIYAIIQVALLTETQKVRAYIVVQELWLAGSKWTRFTVASVSLVFVNTFFLFYSTLRRRQAVNWNGTLCVCIFFFLSDQKKYSGLSSFSTFDAAAVKILRRHLFCIARKKTDWDWKERELIKDKNVWDKRGKRRLKKKWRVPKEDGFFRKAGGKTEVNNWWSLYFSTTDADASCQLISRMFIQVSSASHRGWVHWFVFLL